MIIYDLELPEEIAHAVLELVNGLTDEQVVVFVKRHERVPKGIRAEKRNAVPLRKQLVSWVRGAGEIQGKRLVLLQEVVVESTPFAVLSTAALFLMQDEWLAFFGEANVLACLLLDRREKIREMATSLIKSNFPATLPDRVTAEKNLKDNYWPFLDALGPLLGSSLKKEPKPVAPVDVLRSDELLKLRKEARSGRKLQTALDAEKEKQLKMHNRQEQLKRERADCLEEIVELKTANVLLESSLSRVRTRQVALVRDGVAKELRSAENEWLWELRSTDQAANASPDLSLIERVDHELARQAERDRLHGNRRLLRLRLEKIELAIQRIRSARLEALNPSRELIVLEEQLERQRDEILGIWDDGSKMALPGGLVDQIEQSTDLAELAECKEKVEGAVILDLLGSREAAYLLRMIHLKEQRIYMQSIAPRKIASRRLTGIDRLVAETASGEPFKVWLDGHNIIYGLAELRSMSAEGATHQELRRRLIELVSPCALRNKVAEWVLYFDGTVASEQAIHSNLSVRFSGGVGDQRADNVILGEISMEIPEASALSRYVFTDDRELGGLARDLGVVVLSVEELGGFCR